ncbi:hypothetical protein MRB53_039180 [Persea americana]|nr:hypothetical protein MRB53_039180 [Persea americana]
MIHPEINGISIDGLSHGCDPPSSDQAEQFTSLGINFTVLPDIPVCLAVVFRALALLEPGMFITGMVHDEIQNDFDPNIVTLLDKLKHVIVGAEWFPDFCIQHSRTGVVADTASKTDDSGSGNIHFGGYERYFKLHMSLQWGGRVTFTLTFEYRIGPRLAFATPRDTVSAQCHSRYSWNNMKFQD